MSEDDRRRDPELRDRFGRLEIQNRLLSESTERLADQVKDLSETIRLTYAQKSEVAEAKRDTLATAAAVGIAATATATSTARREGRRRALSTVLWVVPILLLVIGGSFGYTQRASYEVCVARNGQTDTLQTILRNFGDTPQIRYAIEALESDQIDCEDKYKVGRYLND